MLRALRIAALGALGLLATAASADRVYWVEADWAEIQRVNLDGSGFELLLDQNDVGRPHSLALDMMQGKMYITDGNRIWRANLDGSELENPIWDSGIPLGLALEFTEPGLVPESITLDKSALVPNVVTISWEPSCTYGAADYAIYEGAVGEWYGHAAVDCSDDGSDLREEITPLEGDRYLLVVPLNYIGEGSYGVGDGGAQRPVGTPACLPNTCR
jgi:hypothetical protein